MTASFRGQKFLSLETYRKSGEPVRTPVGFAEDGGRLYAMTKDGSGKVKRLRRSLRARAAPCDMRGNLRGEWAEAEARVLQGEEGKRAVRLIVKRYKMVAILMKIIYAVRGRKPVGIEIRLL